MEGKEMNQRTSVWVVEQGDYESIVIGVFSSEEIAKKYVSDWKIDEAHINEEVIDGLLDRKIGHYKATLCVGPYDFEFENCSSLNIEVYGENTECNEHDLNDLDAVLEYSRSKHNPTKIVFLVSCGSTEAEAIAKVRVVFDAWIAKRQGTN
jgi:hypothetical protein